jgi:cell division protease FtsH
MNSPVKTTLFWVMVLVAALLLWKVVQNQSEPASPEISYSEFLSQVEAGNVIRVTITKSQISGKYKGGEAFHVTGPASQDGMLQELHQKGVEIWIRDTDSSTSTLLLNLVPFLLLAVLWVFMIRKMRVVKRAQTQDGNPPPPIG